MEIRRKIACKYLKNQYKKAKEYLEKQINSIANVENIDMICDRVRRAGIAYAQTEYCVFLENGSWGESVISKLNNDSSIISFSLYNEFINEMETYIRSVTSKFINENSVQICHN